MIQIQTYLTPEQRAPWQGQVVVLLLCGSDKSGQAAAIKQAVAYLNDWRKRGEP